MPTFLAGAFALAGAVLALGPVLIHLLDRQRYRKVSWGAMELLRAAEAQTRRILRLRDLLLLALRCACVLLLGLALARPYFSASARTIDPRQPVHAVVVVDNSLSMGYGELRGTLLDEARIRVGEFLDRLPEASRISIIPLCGSRDGIDQEAYRSVADAREALARIETADRAGTVLEAIDLAREACRRVPEPNAKRILFVGDQQQVTWPPAGLEEPLADLPELQVVPVAPRESANAWIEEVRVQDDIADGQTPAVLTATIRYAGPAPRNDVRVALQVDGIPTESRIVDLVPGQSREVAFTHQFTAAEATGESFVPITVSLSPDRLPADDFRCLAVPVFAALPIVFVDQYGTAESPQEARLGETFHLRRLLAPTGASAAGARSARFTPVTIDQLDRALLQRARLVVIAGVESPGSAVPLLREYVEQGGQLLIAAGGRFSPSLWSDGGWQGGAGILPAPLDAALVGRSPDESATTLEPFFLAPTTMSPEFFDITGADRAELDDLYRIPVFFRAAVAHPEAASPAARDRATRASGTAPRWLQWRMEEPTASDDAQEGDAGFRDKPSVLASFSNGHPFLIERRIGAGTVVFASSSVGSNWNDLPRTNAIILFDRLLRRMLAHTLPRRNFETFEQVSFPVRDEDRGAEFRLERPDGPAESIPVDALGRERFGVVLRHLTRRGTYRLICERGSGAARAAEGDRQRSWEIPLAINGPARESDLATIDEAMLRQHSGSANVHWVAPGEAVRLEGADVRGQDLWRWCLWGVLAALLGEMFCVSFVRPGKQASGVRRQETGDRMVSTAP